MKSFYESNRQMPLEGDENFKSLKKAFSKERIGKILQSIDNKQSHVYFLSYCWDNFNIADQVELLL